MNKLTIYTYGGWSFSGTVKKADKIKLTVGLDDGRNAVIFKKHIVAMIDDKKQGNIKADSESSPSSIKTRTSLLDEENQRPSFIPEDMLIGGSSGSQDDDFSMSFSDNKEKNMIFKLEGEDE